jgi:predicted phage terminase large subunit-like protein
MALTAQEVYGFSESLLKARYDDPQPTPDFHLELWERCCSPSRLVAIAAPRGHAKSTSITHAYTLAEVCFQESSYVMIVSDTEEQAVLFLEDIKFELLENEKLRTLFGIKRFIKDTSTDIIVQMQPPGKPVHLFRIIAKGSEQKIRGRKWRNKRPDLIIGDDLENDEIVMNEDRRAKFRRWMNNALIPALSKKGKIRIVGTILHLDSFLERCMPQFDDKEHTHTDGLRWWTTRDDMVWNSIRYQGHDEEFEQLLWPEMWSKERYMAEKRRYVEDGNPEGYAQEYLNYPIDEENSYFKPQDFIPWENYDEYLEYYVGADLAISKKDGRAYTVFVVAGLNREGILVVVDVVRFRGDSLQIIDELFRLQRIYNPEVVWIEEENIARSIGPFLDQAMIQSGVFITIDTDTPSKDKEQRARGIQARMRAGGVRFDTRKDWYQGFYHELVTFPRGKYMDQVDAFSWIGLGLNKVVPTYTATDIAAFEYDDEFDEAFGELGKSRITGY